MKRLRTAALLAAGLAISLPSPGAAQEIEVSENYTAEVMHRLCLGTKKAMPPDMQSMVCTFRL